MYFFDNKKYECICLASFLTIDLLHQEIVSQTVGACIVTNSIYDKNDVICSLQVHIHLRIHKCLHIFCMYEVKLNSNEYF